MTLWTVVTEQTDATDDSFGLAMELCLRTRTVRLGVRALSAGDPPMWHGAVVRGFFEGDHADWAAAAAWLQEPVAQEMLENLRHRYAGEFLWSGDWVGRWSDEGWQDLAQVHGEVARRLA